MLNTANFPTLAKVFGAPKDAVKKGPAAAPKDGAIQGGYKSDSWAGTDGKGCIHDKEKLGKPVKGPKDAPHTKYPLAKLGLDGPDLKANMEAKGKDVRPLDKPVWRKQDDAEGQKLKDFVDGTLNGPEGKHPSGKPMMLQEDELDRKPGAHLAAFGGWGRVEVEAKAD